MSRKVRSLALWSRAGSVFLQFVANVIVPDHQPDVFKPPSRKVESLGDNCVRFMLGGFRRWDAIYFLFVAQFGYIYENCLAFFPLYPAIVRFASEAVKPLFEPCSLNMESLLLVCGSLLNVFFFVEAAHALNQWISAIDRGKFRSAAFPATIAFCFNPASVFFSACYSESLFCYLSFSALLNLERSDNAVRGKLLALIFASSSGMARSNGVAVFGVFILKEVQSRIRKIMTGQPFLINAARLILVSVVYTVMSFVPFVLFQIYSYHLYCTSQKETVPSDLIRYAIERSYVYLDPQRNTSSWCDDAIPLAYSHVQKSHWNVGMFSYYQLKQLPNFLLALPVLTLSFWTLWLFLPSGREVSSRKRIKEHIYPLLDLVTKSTLLPYIVHLAFLVIFCLFFVHIQVSTRLICSSSPLPYLAVGSLVPPLSGNNWSSVGRQILTASKKDTRLKFVVYFFSFYAVIGTVLHVNFLPWT